ncbi:MAG: penicillin-binding protein 1C [Candidatus Adiutrix sp.]|jgi:penicillin-binding protein 1C|nr:penicillin-binding protein 1C [Candidatus Adiutrix sp.]
MRPAFRRPALAGAALAAAGLFWLALGLWPDPLAENGSWNWSVQVTDRRGRPLKEFLPPRPAVRSGRPLAEFSPRLIDAVLAAEDKRFRLHPGFDPLALLRAGWRNLRAGRIESGGSTITMQLARLNRGLTPGPRTYGRKLKELWWALLIERHHSKDSILAEYLNRAPCGRLTEGFAAAASVYLGRSVRDLSWAESAFLAGLPASPGALNPYKDPRPALARRGLILRRLARQGRLSGPELARAEAEPLALAHRSSPFLAPHFLSQARRFFGPAPPPVIATTLDLDIQVQTEAIVRETVQAFRAQGLSQAAVLVLSHPGRQVLAWVGSADFFAADDEGQNDGVLALRQPGSALKPFLYAAAFDAGLIHPASLLNDAAGDFPARGGSFSPANYSRTVHGPVPARLALASSLNLPAVRLAARFGLEPFLSRLQALGLTSLDRPAGHYGLTLPLGGGEVRLKDLTLAYAALADGGRWRPEVMFKGEAGPGQAGGPAQAAPVFSQEAAFLVTDILSDPLARLTGFGDGLTLNPPYPAAVKTGTSRSFRDNWCLGYTTGFVVGVWAGDFRARPMNGVSGVTGAGTIWRRVSDLLAEKIRPAAFPAPPGLTAREVCPASGLLAGPACPNRKMEIFLARFPPPETCGHEALNAAGGPPGPVLGRAEGFGLIRPLNGEAYALDPGLGALTQKIKAQARNDGTADELVWLLNGRELKREAAAGRGLSHCLVPLERGRSRLEVRGLKAGEVTKASAAVFTVR